MIRNRKTPGLNALFIVLILSINTGCTSIITNVAISPAVSNLQRQSDVELVCEGASSYLLMIDSMIAANPSNRSLLLTGTQAYSGTIAALQSCSADSQRIETLSEKAKDYGVRLLSNTLPENNLSVDALGRALAHVKPNNSKYLFWGAFGWLTWVQQQQGSPAAMADLIIIEKLMATVLELDETIEKGSPHIFFGALWGSKPALIGGDLEKSRTHFERALELSNRTFLLTQITYAETYSRMAFDKEHHDSLLQEVLEFPLEEAPESILTNQIAKRKAQKLLDENFFE